MNNCRYSVFCALILREWAHVVANIDTPYRVCAL